MSTEASPLSERSMKILEKRGEDYLLEVFRPWDSFEQRWVDTDTFQLRFETEDLLIGRDPTKDAEHAYWEVLPGINGVHQGSKEGLIGDCVCWLIDETLVDEPCILDNVLSLTLGVLKAF